MIRGNRGDWLFTACLFFGLCAFMALMGGSHHGSTFLGRFIMAAAAFGGGLAGLIGSLLIGTLVARGKSAGAIGFAWVLGVFFAAPLGVALAIGLLRLVGLDIHHL